MNALKVQRDIGVAIRGATLKKRLWGRVTGRLYLGIGPTTDAVAGGLAWKYVMIFEAMLVSLIVHN
jgi:hypothetical protein